MQSTRRDILKASAAGCAALLLPFSAGAAVSADLAKSVARYLASLRRGDGGFGWEDQDESHITPTWAAIQSCRILGIEIPEKQKLAAYIRAGHPFKKKRPEREMHAFEQQQIECLLALGEDASAFREIVRPWNKPVPYPARYERDENPVLRQELSHVMMHRLLGMPMEPLAANYGEFLEKHRRANGSYNHTPAADGSDGHVMNTWWCLAAYEALGKMPPGGELVGWLQSCQLPAGGFTYQPNAKVAANDDAAYTWAALRSLELLGAKPKDAGECIRYLHALIKPNGGFSDRPGWLASPVAAFYALDSLRCLNALDRKIEEPSIAVAALPPLDESLKIFTIQIEAHGQGSPADAVEMARALKIHLWCAKNARPGWIERAQTLANDRKVPVTFCVGNEEYGTYVSVPGLGTYSHTSDIIAPANVDIGRPMTNVRPAPTWEEFRQKRLAPLESAGGRLFWQFGENEELTRFYLDDSLARGGYAAISTFHFGNPDFTLSSPFLYRWHGQIPWIALQDAHGGESWWWGDQLTGFRTLFLAKEPTWDGFLNALKQNWTCAVRKDANSEGRLRMHAGDQRVRELVRRRESDWKWWGDESGRDALRPLVSMVLLRAGDQWETGVPEKGAAVRIRTQWENTAQGLPKRALVELVGLELDGAPLETKLVERRNPQGALVDRYHLAQLSDSHDTPRAFGATLRHVSSGRQIKQAGSL